ncbi:MAG TPA: hypothetical protein VLI91_03125 [Roseiarcus sp.]|nr:hypothetical protein [Roseiarcus sp.]
MFETLSTIAVTAGASLVIGFLACAMAQTPRGRLMTAGVLIAWFVLVLAIGAGGALDPARGLGVPGLGLSVVLPVVALVSAFVAFPPIRAAMLAMPLSALVAVNTVRVLGVIFVALYAAGRLPAPFAPSAGWGDIVTGLVAAPLAWAIARFGARARMLALLWNVFGAADLVNAVALGALSAPGPLNAFPGPPTSAIMTGLPWLIIPGFLVPSLFFVHLVIFHRLLARTEASDQAKGWISGHAKSA